MVEFWRTPSNLIVFHYSGHVQDEDHFLPDGPQTGMCRSLAGVPSVPDNQVGVESNPVRGTVCSAVFLKMSGVQELNSEDNVISFHST